MAEKILVVEDERNIASFVAMYLKNARYQVDIARDGAEALQKADSINPDLVVLDLMLPDIDGLEVCRQIRSTSDVPLLMLTARAAAGGGHGARQPAYRRGPSRGDGLGPARPVGAEGVRPPLGAARPPRA